MAEFTASDGVRIHYEDTGVGRPLLLLHGLMAHGGFWAAQEPLACGFRLIMPDLRGHRDSRAPIGTLTVDRLAEDVAELAVALDLRGAVAVGWSLGASVAWPLLTGAQAGRFVGSVVVDMTPRIRNGEGWELGLSPELIEARSSAFRDDFAGFAPGAGEAILAPPLDAEKRRIADWASAEFARNDPAAMGALWCSLAETDQRPLLGRVGCPSLIIRGAHSYLYGPETAHYLGAALPHARIVEFARSGHAPNLEEPELFNNTISQFVAGLQPAREAQHSI